jgi:hypothetical protein
MTNHVYGEVNMNEQNNDLVIEEIEAASPALIQQGNIHL